MEDNLPAIKHDLFLGANFKETLEIAEFFAKSDLIPTHFRGKPANVFICLELAHRMDISPFMLLHSLYVVHGKPGIEAKLAIALAKKNGWNIEYKVETSGKKTTACTCIMEKNGVKVPGPRIDWELVQAEGWDKKDGSKWKTAADLMFRYRAASWAIRLVCPEVLMGVQTLEELEDVIPISIETVGCQEPEATATQEDPGPTGPSFDTLWEDYQGPHKNLVQTYLEAAAKHNKTTVEATQDMAIKNWPLFIATFEKWSAKQAAKAAKETASAPPAPPKPESNGNAPGPVMAITGEQIEKITELAKIKDCPLEVVCEQFKVSAIAELNEEVAYQVIDWLAGK